VKRWVKILKRFFYYCFIAGVFLLIEIPYTYATVEDYTEKYGEELDHVPFEIRYLFKKSNNLDWDEVDFETREEFLKLYFKWKKEERKELKEKEKTKRKAEREKSKRKKAIEKAKRKAKRAELKRKKAKAKRERERIKAFKKLVKKQKKKLKKMRKELKKKRREARRKKHRR